ncbi:MAG TPA: hypothetical protein VLF14_05480 [Candidatus Binatia bacterium]|nr:hypothetical protein [Candidatus Binatia bacterium]
MRPEAVRFLFASLGFALSLGAAGRGVSVPSADAAVFTQATAIHPGAVVADEEGGSDDSGSGEDDEGDDSD